MDFDGENFGGTSKTATDPAVKFLCGAAAIFLRLAPSWFCFKF
jgi:hypothetical protein